MGPEDEGKEKGEMNVNFAKHPEHLARQQNRA